MFLHLSVSHSVHRGSTSVYAGIPHPQDQATPWGQTPPPPHTRADSPTGTKHSPRADPPGTRHLPPREQAHPPRAGTPPGSRHTHPVQCMLGNMVNKPAVCILLECNLVYFLNVHKCIAIWKEPFATSNENLPNVVNRSWICGTIFSLTFCPN